MKTFLLIMSVFYVLCSNVAFAGVMVEPVLGYSADSYKVTAVNGQQADLTATGMNYGVRIGYKLPSIVWFAADYAQTSGTAKYDNVVAPDLDYSHNSLGLDVGVDMPVGFRAWLGYGFNDTLKFKTSSATDTFTGSSYKVGVGYKIVPKVSLNLEYWAGTYKKYDNGTTSVDLDAVYSSFNPSGVTVSVSVPLGF